ncbi:hypothetical protein KCU81_g513, partial [Aureobasidium melanogenum]
LPRLADESTLPGTCSDSLASTTLNSLINCLACCLFLSALSDQLQSLQIVSGLFRLALGVQLFVSLLGLLCLQRLALSSGQLRHVATTGFAAILAAFAVWLGFAGMSSSDESESLSEGMSPTWTGPFFFAMAAALRALAASRLCSRVISCSTGLGASSSLDSSSEDDSSSDDEFSESDAHMLFSAPSASTGRRSLLKCLPPGQTSQRSRTSNTMTSSLTTALGLHELAASTSSSHGCSYESFVLGRRLSHLIDISSAYPEIFKFYEDLGNILDETEKSAAALLLSMGMPLLLAVLILSVLLRGTPELLVGS